jgi:signal transduction histidine kinase
MAFDIATIERDRAIALNKELKIWHNQGEPAREDEVLSGKMADGFHRSEAQYPGIGFKPGELWARFTLSNSESDDVTLWLENRAPLIDQVSFFMPASNGTYSVRHQGDKVDFRSRELSYRMPAFAVKVPPGTHTYYIRTTTAGSNMLALFLWNPSGFDSHRWFDNALASGMLGILLAIFFYNSFLALSLRSRTYYYYSAFLFFMVGMQFAMLGIPVLCMDTSLGSWFMNEGFLYFSNLTGMCAILVTMSFLNMKEFMPRWYQCCRLMFLIPVIIMIMGFFVSYNIFAFTASTFAGIYCLALLTASFQAVLRGYGPARYYTLAWFFILGATILNSLHYQGVLHPPFVVQFNSLPGAVFEGLLMSLALADRVNFIRNKSERTIRDLNGELSRHISKVEKIVEERTLTIRTILDHVKSGLLIVDRKGIVLGGHSRSCVELLDQEKIEGELFARLLGMEDKEAAQFRMAIDQVFAEFMPVDVSLQQLPQMVNTGSKTLHLEANAIRSPAGEIQHILFTVEDISELRRRQVESRRNRLLIRILSDLAAFRQFIVTSYEAIQRMKQPLDIRTMRFMLHTLKGNSRVFRLNQVARTIHALEDLESIGPREVQKIEEQLEGFLLRHARLLKLPWGPGKEDLTLPHEKVNELTQMIMSCGNDSLNLQLQQWIDEVSQPAIGTLIGPMIASCKITAKRLGKDVKFSTKGESIRTRDPQETTVIESLIHLLRNSVVHGIETDRQSLGKPQHGLIELFFAEEKDTLHIHFRDDGQGFSRKEWEEAAQHQFSMSPSEAAALSLQELVLKLIESGFSTQNEATMDAGRGIGLGGLIRLIQEMGGRIELHSEPGHGFSFAVCLPRKAAGQEIRRPTPLSA